MAAVLDGFRVVDWSTWYIGPGAAAVLGDLGADVIHVEQRVFGDQMRGIQAVVGVPQFLPDGRQATFEYGNRNKRGISLDLTKPEGKEVMYRLVKNSDVFVTNFRASTAERFGLTYEDLKIVNPKIVYLSASTVGLEGPNAALTGLDMVGSAWGGLMMASSDAEVEKVARGEPVLPPIGVADEMTATLLSFGALAGIIARDRQGIGQEIHVSMLGAMTRLLSFLINQNLMLGVEAVRQGRRTARNPLYNLYRCRDGKWIALSLARDKEWAPFCRAVGLAQLEAEPRFATLEGRAENCRELIDVIDRAFATKDRAEWATILRKADLMFAPVNTVADLKDDPQVVANEYITKVDHPSLGEIDFLGFPLHFSETPMTFRRPAPDFGQHTLEVLTEVCGYSEEEVAGLYEREVL